MKNRMVNTRFWQDSYCADLDPVEKLLFLYCLTNNYSTLSGIYEVPLKTIAVETGIDRDMLVKIFARFEKDEKMLYRDGWVLIKNFIKHHEQGSPQVRIGIQKDLANAPDWAKNHVFGEGINTLSPLASTLASTSTSALASTPTVLGADALALEVVETPAQEALVFFTGIQDLAGGGEQTELTKQLAALADKLKVPKATLWHEVQAFTLYWTEKTKNGKRHRWELEKTFEVERRLLTWLRRSSQQIRGPTKPVSKYKAGIV